MHHALELVCITWNLPLHTQNTPTFSSGLLLPTTRAPPGACRDAQKPMKTGSATLVYTTQRYVKWKWATVLQRLLFRVGEIKGEYGKAEREKERERKTEKGEGEIIFNIHMYVGICEIKQSGHSHGLECCQRSIHARALPHDFPCLPRCHEFAAEGRILFI